MWIGHLAHLSSAFCFQASYGTETSSSQLANRSMTSVNISFEIPNQGIQTISQLWLNNLHVCKTSAAQNCNNLLFLSGEPNLEETHKDHKSLSNIFYFSKEKNEPQHCKLVPTQKQECLDPKQTKAKGWRPTAFNCFCIKVPGNPKHIIYHHHSGEDQIK